MFKEPVSDSILDLGHSLAELLCHGLAFEGFDRVGVGGSGHDNEGDDSEVRPSLLESVIESW